MFDAMSDEEHASQTKRRRRSNTNKIKIFVKHPSGGKLAQFNIKPYMQMGKLFHRYADHFGLETNMLRFLLLVDDDHGSSSHIIGKDETPERLGLEDGDHIKCVLVEDEQEGKDKHEEDYNDTAAATARTTSKKTIYVNIKITHQDGRVPTKMRIKSTIKMGKIFTAYAKQTNVDVASLRFFFDGERIQEDDTPKELDINDGDQIDCMLEQDGGGGSSDNNNNRSNIIMSSRTQPIHTEHQSSTTRNLACLIGPTLTVLILTENPYVNPDLYLSQSPPIVYLNGMVFFVAGLAIVREPFWTPRAYQCILPFTLKHIMAGLLIALVGWGSIFLGLSRMIYPVEWAEKSIELHSSFIENDGMSASMFVWELFLLLVGMFLTWYGYYGYG